MTIGADTDHHDHWSFAFLKRKPRCRLPLMPKNMKTTVPGRLRSGSGGQKTGLRTAPMAASAPEASMRLSWGAALATGCRD